MSRKPTNRGEPTPDRLRPIADPSYRPGLAATIVRASASRLETPLRTPDSRPDHGRCQPAIHGGRPGRRCFGPGRYVSDTATFVPIQPAIHGGSAAADASEADTNPGNNLAFANVVAGMFQVNNVTALPIGNHAGSILFSFSSDLVLANAWDINHYHLTIPALKAYTATPVRVVSATFNKAHRQVLLKLVDPGPWGDPILGWNSARDRQEHFVRAPVVDPRFGDQADPDAGSRH